MKTVKSPWWAKGLRFECKGCGACCTGEPGHVWLTKQELRDIAEYCAIEPRKFRKNSTRRVWRKITLIEQKSGDCLMYHRGRGCLIYPVRPAQCRTYPFWKNILKSPRSWKREGRQCPGIGGGRKFPLEEIKHRLEQKW
ncbi:MAG: YkgJ family cysteine cluster protein [Planctomycetota bacterium]|nr:MAG: YkgJ family cysteine cluster protein [Planctomycetota bacterium]